jgi:glycosyltransferase involved in cell wall biosynthesis
MISIITVNYNSYDFLGLLIESLYLFSTLPYELIVVDNSDNRVKLDHPNVHQYFMPTNIGHGRGLNFGVTKAYERFRNNPFLMFLDCDCHILKMKWESAFIGKMKNHDIIGGKGPASKPIRPACIFMKKELGQYDWSDTLGYAGNRSTPGGYDVAIKAYYKIMADNLRIGFLTSKKSEYNTVNGEEWCIDDIPYVYHHWHGSHLKARQEDFPGQDLIEDKNNLFSKIHWHLP